MNDYYIVYREEENVTYLYEERNLNPLTKCWGKRTKEEMIEQFEQELKDIFNKF
jgi:ribosome biogenesis protein Nip4